MNKSKSSGRWLQEHFSDQYVNRARQEGYRSRAAYKLLEINNKAHLFKSGMTVVDLGAAPGGWSQVAEKLIGPTGKIIAVDILAMDSLPNVTFIHGDFTSPEIVTAVLTKLDNNPVDLVLSDMAPNMSGIKDVDQARILAVLTVALDFAKKVLRPGGNFLAKIFQGEGSKEFQLELKKLFQEVKVLKPEASRERSAEFYLLAKNFRAKTAI